MLNDLGYASHCFGIDDCDDEARLGQVTLHRPQIVYPAGFPSRCPGPGGGYAGGNDPRGIVWPGHGQVRQRGKISAHGAPAGRAFWQLKGETWNQGRVR